MKTNALQKQHSANPQVLPEWDATGRDPTQKYPPRSAAEIVRLDEAGALQMYTEDEVASMLRVSLSQLRKWRITRNKGKVNGPPFKKVGRLVRYPRRALQAYINGD